MTRRETLIQAAARAIAPSLPQVGPYGEMRSLPELEMLAEHIATVAFDAFLEGVFLQQRDVADQLGLTVQEWDRAVLPLLDALKAEVG